MASNRKSIVPFEVDYNFDSFPLGYGSAQGKVKISGRTASWDNGVITVTENTTSIKPTIYSSFKDGNDRLQPSKPIDSSEYIPLATITVTNNQEPDGTLFLYNPGQIPLDSTINLALKGGIQNINFAPLKIQRIYIGFKDFAENRESNINKDAVVFPNVSSYQNLKIINPQTGRSEPSAFYFGYEGAVEGSPRKVTKDKLLVPGGKAGNTAPLDDGQTKTFTLYGRLFVVDIFDPIKIVSISEDTGIKGDFRTSDNTLIFNGTAEAGSKVEVFVNNKSIGIAYVDAKGNWSYDHSQVKLPDGKYPLTATETNLFGEVKTTVPTTLEIDTDYDIELDFSDTTVANNKTLQNQIKKAAEYWESIILDDIPDVNGVGGFIDDLKIKFVVEELKNNKGGIDGKEKTLALASNYDTSQRVFSQNSVDPLTGQPLSSFNYLPSYAIIKIDSADLDAVTKTYPGLQTLQHEIAHAIGFNSQTLKEKKFVKEIQLTDGSYRYGFTEKKALVAYHALGGKASHRLVPLEHNEENPSEKFNPGHWNEWLFPDSREETILGWFKNDELMTTATPPGKDALLSKLTLGAFEDLGFTVDETKAGNINVFTGFGFVGNPLFDMPYW